MVGGATPCENKQLFARRREKSALPPSAKETAQSIAQERERTHIVCSISQFSEEKEKKVFSECEQLGACELSAGAGGAARICVLRNRGCCGAEVISKMCTRREVSVLLSTPAEMDLTKKWERLDSILAFALLVARPKVDIYI
jgi:hypothetical protein